MMGQVIMKSKIGDLNCIITSDFIGVAQAKSRNSTKKSTRIDNDKKRTLGQRLLLLFSKCFVKQSFSNSTFITFSF